MPLLLSISLEVLTNIIRTKNVKIDTKIGKEDIKTLSANKVNITSAGQYLGPPHLFLATHTPFAVGQDDVTSSSQWAVIGSDTQHF